MRTWSGVIAFTDDLAPMVGETGGCPGYYPCVASTGFTLGPLMARLLAESMSTPGGAGAASRRLPARPPRAPAGRKRS